MKEFFAYYNINHNTDRPHKPTGQVVVDRCNCTLNEMLIKQKERKILKDGLDNALLTLNFLNINEKQQGLKAVDYRKNWN